MQVETGYYCKECNSPVMIIGGEVVRSCTHSSTIIAECEAHVTAHGGVTNAVISPSNG